MRTTIETDVGRAFAGLCTSDSPIAQTRLIRTHPIAIDPGGGLEHDE
jgi:hypothetical protein